MKCNSEKIAYNLEIVLGKDYSGTAGSIKAGLLVLGLGYGDLRTLRPAVSQFLTES